MLTTRNVLLWLHILLAVMVFGPLLFMDMVTPRAVREGNLPVLRWLVNVGKPLGPATIAVVLAGVALVLRNGDDPYSFGKPWISASLGLYVVAVANGVGNLERALHRAVERLERGDDAQAEARLLRIFGPLNILVILTILWLMVARPGA